MSKPLDALRASLLALALLAAAAPAAFAAKHTSTTSTSSGTTSTSTLSSTTSTTTATSTSGLWAPTDPSAFLVEPRPFSPNDFWDTQIPATQAADPNSTTLVSDLLRQVQTYGTWINTTQYSYPVYTVPAAQPLVPVILDNHPYSPLRAKFAAGVPLPPTAQGAAGSDGAAIVWQPSTDTYWEFWRLQRLSDGFHAQYGGILTHASTSPGVFTDGTGTSASGLALLGGEIRPGEYRSFVINHALKIGVPQVTAGVIRAPATRTDGTATGGIPMGTRFQVDPSVNVWNLNIPFQTKILAYAAQRYGVIVGDSSGAVGMYAEDPQTMTYNPWPQLWSNMSPGVIMRAFPWSLLRALPPTPATS